MPDHRDLIELDAERCWELLRSVHIARVGFVNNDGVVDVLPVNHVVHGGTLAWLSATGSKLAVAANEKVIAVEADAIDDETRTGWSVVVHGTAKLVTHPAREQQLYAQGTEPWTAADRRVFWIELEDPTITGRQIS